MIDSNGVSIFYRAIGFGSPVILLHGFNQNSGVFYEPEKHLAQRHRVILIDSRGHGRSARGDEPFSIALMARDVVAVMDELGLERTAIIGFSDGANIALQLAVDFPERVSLIVAISGNTSPKGLRPVYFFGIHAWRRIRELFGSDTRMMDLLTHEPQISDEALSKITAPALLIYAAHDTMTAEHIKTIHAMIPNAKLLYVKGAWHFNIMSFWKKYGGEIERFLTEEQSE